jgi:curved DNA-binding protein
MEYKDYYKTLGVAKSATADDIKKAFRQLARKYHPDINKDAGAEAKFKEINEANDVLSDPEKRKAYDELGSGFAPGQEFRPPPDWQDSHHFRQSTGTTRASAQDFSDFFEELFGSRARPQQRQRAENIRMRGEDSHARIVISLRDSFQGAMRQITLRVPELTPAGDVTMRDKVLQVKIPKGIIEGKTIRLKGQGGPGFNGGEAGDLYLEVAFAPDPVFRAEGRDLFVDLPVAPWEAALGASVRVPTPEGPIMLRIPPNSADGRELHARGKGLPGDNPGNLVVKLKIVWPAADSEKARAAYETMARDIPFDARAGWEGAR